MRKKLTRLVQCLVFFSCALLMVQEVLAQGARTVTGVVRNQDDQSPVSGAALFLKGSKTVAGLTDSLGNFRVRVPAGTTELLVTGVGMQNATVAIPETGSVTVSLQPFAQLLNDVVVVGYGTQKKAVVTGAIASISQRDLEVPGIMRADQALQGKTPGVTVMMNSGQPGSGVSIRIRGVGTNGSNDPLFIVDGFPMGDLESINPRDIESMDVLKDAASAAIYGARGANGVIIITTKKGKSGKPRIDYDYYYGIQNIRKYLDVLDATQYARILNESYFNSNLPLPFSEEEILKMGKGTDWQREVAYRNAPMQSHQLSLAGGSDKSTYNTSFSYFKQDGTLAKGKSAFERYTARVNTEQKHLNDVLTTGVNINVTHVKRASIATNSGNAGPILSAINMDPVTTVMNDDGAFAISRYVAQEIVNPIARIYYTNGSSSYTRLNGNAFGELKIIKGLKLRSTIGYTIQYDESRSYMPIYYLNATNFTNTSGTGKSMAEAYYLNLENVLTYNKTIGRHNFTALAGNTVNTGNGSNVSGSKNGLLYDDPAYAYLDLAKDNTSAGASGGAWHSGLISYFGRINYDYDGRFMATAIFRADGSFHFGPNNRIGYFPSLSAGWNMHKEAFMRDLNWLNTFKLRASWGRTGNDNTGGDYRYVSVISTSARNYYFGSGGSQFIGASPAGISNFDLKWETSEQANIGFDATFLKNFSATVDLYSKKTKDLLVNIPIPLYVGNTSPVGNAGNVENRGVELSVGYRNHFKKFQFDVTVNGAYNQNRVTYVGNSTGIIDGSAANNQMSAVTRMQAGAPIGYFWLYTMDGIFQTQSQIDAYKAKDGTLIQPKAVPGDIRYKDLNGDGVIDNQDRSMVGSPHPKFNYGLNLNLRYENFDCNIFVYGLAGNKIFNALRRWDLPAANYPSTVLNRWHGEGTSNEFPRVSTGDLNGNFSNPSTFFLEDGSFLRLKNLSLGYTFRNLQAVKLNTLRLYVTGTNLLMLTKYTGFDPEISGSALGLGIDKGVYPQPRTVTFGVSVGF